MATHPVEERKADKSQTRLVKTQPFAARDNKWHVVAVNNGQNMTHHATPIKQSAVA